jgi:MarR family transcriptional regulator, lower aerobic nicotinate degradation pathway regulator
MATSQADAAARELLHVVMLVMRTLAADMRRSSRPLAPTQMGSLMRIAAGPCRMSDLARHQAVSLPTISKSVDMLVRRGWVERWVDKEDRRQSLVRLTPKGRRVLAEIKDRSERHVAETLAPLNTRECTQLMTALGALARVLAMSEPDELCAPKVKRR